MLRSPSHLSDGELLLAMDRELTDPRLAVLRTHVAACEDCRSRSASLAVTIAELTSARVQDDLPPADAARIRLRAALATSRAGRGEESVRTHFRHVRWLGVAAALAASIVIASKAPSPPSPFGVGAYSDGALMRPRSELTPGAVRTTNASDICGPRAAHVTPAIAGAVQEKVFAAYGARIGRSSDYELDHLITPELGGTSDARNLWPQPFFTTEWNAYVKDELERHLHTLVCEGTLAVKVAQREMATDWITAYKRRFATDHPLAQSMRTASDRDAADEDRFELDEIEDGRAEANTRVEGHEPASGDLHTLDTWGHRGDRAGSLVDLTRWLLFQPRG